MASDWFKGKKIIGESPEEKYIYENILCRHFSKSPEDIRKMDYVDFRVHLNICIAKEEDDRNFRILLSGGKTTDDISPDDVARKAVMGEHKFINKDV